MAARQRERGGAMASLDLALIGNGTIGAFVDPAAEITWTCFPRFDGDPMFCSLLKPGDDIGFFAIELLDRARVEQKYLHNTPVVVTRVTDSAGGAIEITDFAPRFNYRGRVFSPMMIVRRIQRLAGHPRIRVRLRPAQSYGQPLAATTSGSNHIRYVGNPLVLRLTTDVPVTTILEGNAFFVDDAVTLVVGPDETLQEAAGEVGKHFLSETTAYWREWVRSLAIPFEWQDAVIRAAITLKLNVFEDTGAIVAALTTSIPEAAGSSRNWDYRYCWLRDAYFVVNALNRLGATQTMERYLNFILNIVADGADRPLDPVYTITGHRLPPERVVASLPGYRGIGRIAKQLGLADRAAYWCDRARELHEVISQRAWNAKLGTFVATFGGDTLDASLLQLNELFFVADDDPRFVATVRAIGKELKRGKFVFR